MPPLRVLYPFAQQWILRQHIARCRSSVALTVSASWTQEDAASCAVVHRHQHVPKTLAQQTAVRLGRSLQRSGLQCTPPHTRECVRRVVERSKEPLGAPSESPSLDAHLKYGMQSLPFGDVSILEVIKAMSIFCPQCCIPCAADWVQQLQQPPSPATDLSVLFIGKRCPRGCPLNWHAVTKSH